MKKYNFNGRQYIDLVELRKEIRRLRKGIPFNYANFDEDRQAMINLAYNDIGKAVYREELAKAKTPDEIRAVWDMPKEYVVHCGKNYFIEWHQGNAVIGGFDLAMVFMNKGMAKHTAEKLGRQWVVDDYKATKLLKAIFDTPTYTEQQADGVKEILASALEDAGISEEAKDRVFDVVSGRIDGMVEKE